MADDRIPNSDEFEALFVNNPSLAKIEAHLNRFNPIKIMKMERMEIRHSAILSWLMNPSETHGLGDKFLKAFLAEAMRGHHTQSGITALSITQSDLRDVEVRTEWFNIDILLLSGANGWAFIVENKFDSSQRKNQLAEYREKLGSIYRSNIPLRIQGVFLTLWNEVPDDNSYVSIGYERTCVILTELIERQTKNLPPDVETFIRHYIELLKDVTDMNEETKQMEKIARELYIKHKKVLEFINEHGITNDFSTAISKLFGDEPSQNSVHKIGNYDYVYGSHTSTRLSFLPLQWYKFLGGENRNWPGCENWFMGFPLSTWFLLISDSDGTGGKLRLNAEVGPLADDKLRAKIIKNIAQLNQPNISFQKNAANPGNKYSRFLKNNTLKIADIRDPEILAESMIKLLGQFSDYFELISNELQTLHS